MKKLMTAFAMLAAVSLIAGCFTSATARTKRTVAKDGVVTLESEVSIVGTGDKASEVAAEGLFADGTSEDLGSGVKNAKTSQQSTGIEGTLNGLGDLMGGMAQFMLATQSLKVPAAVASVSGESVGETDVKPSAASSAGYDAAPGVNWVGVYGRPSCAKCQAYRAAHPDTAIVNIDDAANKTAMWAALENRGFKGSTVALPVQITADGYALGVK